MFNCLCDLYDSRDFGFVGFCQCREHLFIMVCVSLMDGLTENKAWRKPRLDAHFRLKESQLFRGIVSILVLNKKVRLVFRSVLGQVGIRRYIQVLFNQDGMACYKIIILGIAARKFVF